MWEKKKLNQTLFETPLSHSPTYPYPYTMTGLTTITHCTIHNFNTDHFAFVPGYNDQYTHIDIDELILYTAKLFDIFLASPMTSVCIRSHFLTFPILIDRLENVPYHSVWTNLPVYSVTLSNTNIFYSKSAFVPCDLGWYVLSSPMSCLNLSNNNSLFHLPG